MCYSAMVLQDAKKLSLRFQARVQTESYLELFLRRLSGEKITLNLAMEDQFLGSSENPEEQKIKEAIEKWRHQETSRLHAELFKQKERLANAERSLRTKSTQKALNDQRIASNKIEKFKSDLKRLTQTELKSDSSQRIFPFHYLSLLTLDDNGERIIAPFRYHMRPHDKDADFDREYGGCYNARFDNLKRVAFWKDSLAKRRGLILVRKFYENVAVESYLKNHSLTAEQKKQSNLVLCFEPDQVDYMLIPTLWDCWTKKGESSLYSTALITDEPAPEIAAAGHDRTPIFLKESAIDHWLNASSIEDAIQALGDREKPHYSHSLVGAA